MLTLSDHPLACSPCWQISLPRMTGCQSFAPCRTPLFISNFSCTVILWSVSHWSVLYGPGQQTPVHDHMVWGFVGMLRGAELSQRYRANTDGSLIADGEPDRLEPGMVDALLPAEGDIHQVFNAYKDKPSISIHLYGGNIGAVNRHVFDLASGQPKTFISGYSSDLVPNVWDRSASRKT